MKKLEEILERDFEPLDKTLFRKFLSDELTVKEVKSIDEILSVRFCYIIHTIAAKTNREVSWYDYDNEGGERMPGYFDTSCYKDVVGYTGEFINLAKNRLEDYDDSFPVSWFYETFENQLEQQVENYFNKLEEDKVKKVEIQKQKEENLARIRDRITAKLTVEELTCIKFVSIDEINTNKEKITKSISKQVSIKVKELEDLGISAKNKYAEYKQTKKKPLEFNAWLDLTLASEKQSLQKNKKRKP